MKALRLKQFGENLVRTVDRLCGVDPDTDYKRAAQCRLIVAMSVLFSVITGGQVLEAFIAAPGMTPSKAAGLIATVMYMAAPALLVLTRRPQLSSYVLLAVIYLTVVFVAANNGGVEWHTSPFLLLVPLVAGFLIGARAAFIGAVLVATTLVGLHCSAVYGWIPPSSYDYQQAQWVYVFAFSAVAVTSALLVVAYAAVARDAERRLGAARDAADAANVAKSEFLATISHEIRTPLNAVIGLTGALLKTSLTERQSLLLREANQAGAHLLTLVSDILDLSKLEAKQFEVDSAAFDLRAMLDNATGLFREASASKGLKYAMHIDASTPARVEGDVDKLRQVLVNLISNAVKFTENGSITVTVALASSAPEDGDVVLRFAVGDTGAGVPEDKLDTLFRPFTQADASTRRRYGGTGLGLSICKQLVELMDGRIGAESTAGEGSTFWFEAPLRIATAIEAARVEGHSRIDNTVEREADDMTTDKKGERARVLAVDDNPANRMVITEFLRALGYDFEVVDSGHAAIEQLEARSFDVLLLDIEMPEFDGLQTAAAIRALEGPAARIPITALTAHAFESERARIMAAGMDAFLTKPITIDTLERTIEDLVKKRVSSEEPAQGPQADPFAKAG